jgi:hypothetical protein
VHDAPARTGDRGHEVAPLAATEFASRNAVTTPEANKTFMNIQNQLHGNEAGLSIPPAHAVLADASSSKSGATAPTEAAPVTNNRSEDVTTSQEAMGFKHVKSTVGVDQTRLVDVTTTTATTQSGDSSPNPAPASSDTAQAQPKSSFDAPIPTSAPPQANFDTIDARGSLPQTPAADASPAMHLNPRNDIADTINT